MQIEVVAPVGILVVDILIFELRSQVAAAAAVTLKHESLWSVWSGNLSNQDNNKTNKIKITRESQRTCKHN